MFDTIEVNDVKNDIGLLIKAIRKQRSISQQQLAVSLDVSRTTIQNLEKGKNFTVDTLLKVLKELDLLDQLHAELSQAAHHLQKTPSLY